MKERDFQNQLIKKLKSIFLGCIILKNDANYIQGIPDISIFYMDKWAMLECKANDSASLRPNQMYYIEKANEMSFARVIFPENEEVVLNDLSIFLKGVGIDGLHMERA